MSIHTGDFLSTAIENLFRSITAFLSTATAIFLAGWYPGGETIISPDQIIIVYALIGLGVLAGYKPVIIMAISLYHRWQRQ